jgi:hypothetical protein
MAWQRKKTIDIPGTKAHQRYYATDAATGKKIRVPGADESSRYLMRWANNLGQDGYDHEKYVDKLANVGTCTHARALNFFLGKDIHEFDGEFNKWELETADECWKKFEEWTVGKEFDPIVVEESLVSEVFKFGGTPDFYGRIKIDGRWYYMLLDWKTSKYIYKSHWYQVAGYNVILEEKGRSSEAVGILRMGKEVGEGFEFKHRPVLSLDGKSPDMVLPWLIFKTGLQLHQLQLQEPKWN